MKHLGERLDIHCGGIDNAFPHHTNEIAQSEAYLGHKWCNYWFHVLHLNTNSGKMSKSTGEFLTVSLLESKGYDSMEYRFFCLQSHYRKNLVFSYENLDNAKTAYGKLIAKIAALSGVGEVEQDKFVELKTRFTDAMDNDLNTSLGITALYDVLKANASDATKLALISDFDRVLSLDLIAHANEFKKKEQEKKNAVPEGVSPELAAEISVLIEERKEAKKAKNYARADEIRKYLADKGVILVDTSAGTTYKLG